jgi:hypothetical protein
MSVWCVAAVGCLSVATMVRGQGSLTPSGAPGPTMKSLQELWDSVQTL